MHVYRNRAARIGPMSTMFCPQQNDTNKMVGMVWHCRPLRTNFLGVGLYSGVNGKYSSTYGLNSVSESSFYSHAFSFVNVSSAHKLQT
jgi:hypothetical protein